MTAPRITWIRAGDRYPDLKHDLDNFIALDGEAEIGLVKWVETGPDHGWFWSMTLVHAGSGLQAADMGAMRDARAGGAGAGRLLRGVPGVLRHRVGEGDHVPSSSLISRRDASVRASRAFTAGSVRSAALARRQASASFSAKPGAFLIRSASAMGSNSRIGTDRRSAATGTRAARKTRAASIQIQMR